MGKSAILVSILPLMINIYLFSILRMEEVDDGRGCTNFWFVFFPTVALGLTLFMPRFCTGLVPDLDRTWQIVLRELACTFAMAILTIAGLAMVSIGFDVFPVP